MSNTTPPPSPGVPPAKKGLSNGVVIGAAAARIAAVGATGFFVVQPGGDGGKRAAAVTNGAFAEEVRAAAAEEAEGPEPSYTEPDADSFTMKLRTTSRQCFGSAGCDLTVEPDVTHEGIADALDPDAVYEVTYVIRGDASGPAIETAELSDRTSLNGLVEREGIRQGHRRLDARELTVPLPVAAATLQASGPPHAFRRDGRRVPGRCGQAGRDDRAFQSYQGRKRCGQTVPGVRPVS